MGLFQPLLWLAIPLTAALAQDSAPTLFDQAEKLRADPKTRKQSIPLYQRAAALAVQTQDAPTEAKSRLRLGQVLDISGDPALALKQFEAGLAPALAAADKSTEAGLQYGVARTRFALNQIPASLAAYQAALALRRQTGQRFEEALVQHNLGAALWSLGRNHEASAAYESALAIRRDIQDQPGVAYTLYGLANIHWTWGDPAKALDAYRQTLQLWRSLKDTRGEAESLNSIGLMYAALGDLRQAKLHYNQSLAVGAASAASAAGNNSVPAAYTLNNLGMAEGPAGRRSFEKALLALRAANDTRGQAYVLHNLAGLDPPGSAAAIDRYRESLALKRQIGDRWAEAETLIKLAGVLRRSGDADQALQTARDAVALERQLGNSFGESTAQAVEAAALRALGRLPEAAAALEAALPRIEKLRAGLLNPDLRASFFATQQSLYRDTVEVLMELGRFRDALDVNERSRSRVLLDQVFRARQARPEDQSLLLRQQSVEREINVLSQRLQRASAPEVRSQLDTSLQEWSAIEADRIAAAGLDRWVASPVEALQSTVLDSQTALVEYAFCNDSAWAWVLTRDALRAVKLPPRARLDALVRRHQTAIAARASDPAAERELHRALIASLGPLRGVERLIVVPAGPLEELSLASLPETLSRFELIEAPSAATLLALRQRPRPHPQRQVTIFADPVFSAGDSRLAQAAAESVIDSVADNTPEALPRLHFSRVEAEDILKLAPPGSVLQYHGFAAARSQLSLPASQDTRFLHLATHATAGAVLLSGYNAQGAKQNGRLTLDEIYRLPLTVETVVLSACGTAAGPSLDGEGAISLARAFLYAGATRVLATQWQVQDRATAELMKRFYSGVFTGKLAPAAALRAAQLSLRADPRWQSPYYWAAFRLSGDWL